MGLKERFEQDVAPALTDEFGYATPMQVPRVRKVVVNIGLGEALTNARALDHAAADLAVITGQRPVITRARKSIATFKVREGNPIGCKVTLRRARMYEFFDRLLHVALPRVRDFRGLPTKSFDGHGNYSFGLSEQTVFPEVNVDKVEHVQGMDITIVTTSRTDEEARELLRLFGVPLAAGV